MQPPPGRHHVLWHGLVMLHLMLHCDQQHCVWSLWLLPGTVRQDVSYLVMLHLMLQCNQQQWVITLA
jgi:hypothetical protein